jgi:hypothetical protein
VASLTHGVGNGLAGIDAGKTEKAGIRHTCIEAIGPATCIGCRTGVLSGKPDPKYISTSYVERQNLSMRMGMRRFTRLTNGHSKKIENHGHQVALYFFHYNFCRIHSSLRVTPAIQAGLTDHVWSLEELCALLPQRKPNAKVDKELVLKALARAN